MTATAKKVAAIKVEKLAYSVPEAAAALSLGLTTMFKIVAEGRVKTFKIGRRTLVSAESLRALLDQAA